MSNPASARPSRIPGGVQSPVHVPAPALMPVPASIPHGGNLRDAILRYGIARESWIDLSTGINPHGFPVPSIDASAWLRLPDDDDELDALAAAHYRAAYALSVAGTQAAIRMLPALLPHGPVGVGLLTYGEYAPAFAAAGFPVEHYATGAIEAHAHAARFTLRPHAPLPSQLKHLVVVNPNNPTAELFDADTLLDWRRQLQSRGGTLIVDEAFIDATPEHSIAWASETGNLIVLRSVGKFFGLAGARAGFVLAEHACVERLRALRGPWTVSGPARAVVAAALRDAPWQQQTCTRLDAASLALARLLSEQGLAPRSTALFAWIDDSRAADWHERLAQRGIWVRRFDTVPSLRFGLPADEKGWNRLAAALPDMVRGPLARHPD